MLQPYCAVSVELVINKAAEGVRIAMLENGRLVEFHQEDPSSRFTVGDLFLGQVKKVMPGLNAAFVDIGHQKDAFLHYLDLGPKVRTLLKVVKSSQNGQQIGTRLQGLQYEPEIHKLGKIAQVLTRNQRILVQVAKEPISTKGPRLTCELSLAGRYIVLVPFSDTISISKKIEDRAERKRLQRLMEAIKPANFGVIIRTVAKGKEVAELDKDLRQLVARWEEAMKSLPTAQPRDKVSGEMSRTSSLIRDLLNEKFDAITVDDEELYEQIRGYIHQIAPDKEKIVKLHNSKVKLYEMRGIEKQIKALFGKTVSVQGGGYLVIEHTEALHVVDVNSGNKSNSEESQEATALTVNLNAAKEVARQLRMRDMGGIIVIDFIDMKNPNHKKQLVDLMEEELSKDKARSVVLPLSKFGLMQITRQRVRPEMNLSTSESCPTCEGTGKAQPTILIPDLIEERLGRLFPGVTDKEVTVVVHPFLESFLNQGFKSVRRGWQKKYKRKIRVEKDSSLALSEFQVLNQHGEELEMAE